MIRALDDLLERVDGVTFACNYKDLIGGVQRCERCQLCLLRAAAARVRAEMARGEMSDEELGDITAQHFSPLAWTYHRKFILAFGRAVERAVRERCGK